MNSKSSATFDGRKEETTVPNVVDTPGREDIPTGPGNPETPVAEETAVPVAVAEEISSPVAEEATNA